MARSAEPVEHADVSGADVRRALLTIAAVATVVFVAVYGFSSHTRWGQHLDSAAIRGRRILSQHNIHLAAQFHRTIDVSSLALLGGAIVLVALARGRPRLALGAAAIIVGSLSTSELLKRVLGRADYGIFDILKNMHSYPSGHTTIAMSLSTSAILAAPRRYRGLVAVFGVLFASGIGCSVVITASHRPSDAIGAALVVTVWSAVIASILLGTESQRPAEPSPWVRVTPWMAVVGVALMSAAFIAVLGLALSIHYGGLGAIELGRAFVAAAVTIVGTVVSCTAALLIALRDADLDPPRLSSPTSEPAD